MIRSFNQWLSNIPKELQIEARKWYDSEKPTLQFVNYISVSNILSKTEDLNPIPDEVENWIETNQIEKILTNFEN